MKGTGSVAVVPWRRMPEVLLGLVRHRRATLAALSKAYPRGVVIRTPRRRILVISSEAAVRHVLVEAAGKYAKGLGQAEAGGVIGDGILTAHGVEWRDQRRAIGPRLAARAVTARSDRIESEADGSVTSLELDDWTTVNMSMVLADYTLRCLAHVLGLPAPPSVEVVRALDTVQDEAIFRSITSELVPMWLTPRRRGRVRAAQQRLAVTTRELSSVYPDEPWSTDAGMASLLLAGYETTASTLSWVVSRLAHDPQSAGASAESLLAEVLEESPPVWLISRRALQPDVVDGVPVRTGDDLAIVSGAGATAHLPLSLVFGLGPRACPGSSLARLEARAWLHRAVERLEFRACLGSPLAGEARMSYAPRPPLLVEVRARRSPAPPPTKDPLRTPRRGT